MAKYRKKPVVIEAEPWNGTDSQSPYNIAVKDMVFRSAEDPHRYPSYAIETLEGWMKLTEGDMLITGVNGEYYCCKPDIFEKTYEKVN